MLAVIAAPILSAIVGMGLSFTQPNQVPLIPLMFFIMNGSLCFYYTILWLQSKIDVFDPLGLLGAFGIVFYLAGPVMQIGSDYWPFIPSLRGQEDWFTIWAALNSVGLAIFALIVGRPTVRYRQLRSIWVIDFRYFKVIALIALAITAASQAYIFAKFGGVSGFIQTFSERQELHLGRTENDPFENLGFIVVIAESFKYTFAMCCITYLKGKRYAKNIILFAALMSSLLAIFLVFGGLRGSRNATVFSLIFAVGMYSFWIKKVKVKLALAGVLFVFAFLTAYNWYKIAGVRGVGAIFDAQERASFNNTRQDNSLFVFTRDMGRMDVQVLAMIGYEERGVPLRHGLTYAGAPFTVVPTAVVPWKPTHLAEAKSDVVFGVGQYNPKYRMTTILFGLFGEAFINFWYVGAVLSYAGLALVVRFTRRLVYGLAENDARRLLVPVFCLLPINMLLADAGVLVMMLTRALLIPTAVIMASVRVRRRLSARPGDEALTSRHALTPRI